MSPQINRKVLKKAYSSQTPNDPSVTNWAEPRKHIRRNVKKNAWIECGWGRLIFAHTFEKLDDLSDELKKEDPLKRDIALYLMDPHVLLSKQPQDFFLDPSHTFRIRFEFYRAGKSRPQGFLIRRIRSKKDIKEINEIYRMRKMIPLDEDYVWSQRKSRSLTYLVAENLSDHSIVGTVVGVDHVLAFKDIWQGSSLWALAVHPDTKVPGVGEALSRHLIEFFQARGRAHLDLSVLHNNNEAMTLYRKLGFKRVSVFCVKKKNDFNRSLFSTPHHDEKLNPYAEIILQEAHRRGIISKILDKKLAIFRLTFGGRSVTCRESLSELTSATSLLVCDHKILTQQIFNEFQLKTPAQTTFKNQKSAIEFLKKFKRLVVKPERGEQGRGISVDISDKPSLLKSIEIAQGFDEKVILEEFIEGKDLRIVVINNEVVAAALRIPPSIIGTGRHTVAQLIQKLSRRRMASTHGESKIPIDSETERCINSFGYKLSDILPKDIELQVRKTANLHTGGVLKDVTREIHPKLKEVAIRAAQSLRIPVVGLDLIIQEVDQPDYHLIEANERPGLANHEPQPTAEKFIDLLFPQTKRLK